MSSFFGAVRLSRQYSRKLTWILRFVFRFVKKLNEFQQWPQSFLLLPAAAQDSCSSVSDDLCFAIGPCRFHDIDGHIGRLQEEPFSQSCATFQNMLKSLPVLAG